MEQKFIPNRDHLPNRAFPCLAVDDMAKGDAACVVLIFLSRHSLGDGGCSMKITEDVRKYAAEQEVSENEALRAGMEQKAREFTEAGVEIYSKA